VKNSRNKGKVGEREAAKELGLILGLALSRGAQHKGGPTSPDITLADGYHIPGLHFEVKRCENTSIKSWFKQAAKEAPDGSVPVIWHKKNRQDSVVMMRTHDVARFAHNVFKLLALTAGQQTIGTPQKSEEGVPPQSSPNGGVPSHSGDDEA
jgi:hypothetical protein